MHVSVDIFHNDDGIINQNSDRKIKAKRETLFKVNPQAQLAKSVKARVKTTAAPTIIASRQPMVNRTKSTTNDVAKASLPISLLAFAAAVAP